VRSDLVALVTGAAKRIGNVVARDLAAHGHRIVVHANSSFAEAEQFVIELKQAGTDAIAIQAELHDPTAIQRMVEKAIGAFGRIDALVNCAAIWKAKSLEETTAEDVREHFEVNTLGTFLCCQHVGLKMCEQPEGGAIVNLGDWAIERPYIDHAAYFVSKGSIPTMTRTFAVELAKRNPRVRVNAILPGPVMLPPSLTPAERQAVIDATLVRREGTPEHIAQSVRFLLANDFITGVCLPVDGGRTIFGGTFDR
jgi:pteridine reductase